MTGTGSWLHAACALVLVWVLSGCSRGPARHEGASFGISPDAKLIAFTTGPGAGNTLKVWKEGGSMETLASGAYFEGPAVAPDGKTVLVATGNSFRAKLSLVKLDLATKQQQRFADIKDQSQYSPAYSPDGQWVAFRSAAKPRSQSMGGVQWTDYDLYLADAKGSNVRRLTHDKADRMTPPRWSPDGKLVAVACSDREGRTWIRAIRVEDGSVAWEVEGQNNESMPCFLGNRVVIVSDRENVGRYRLGFLNNATGKFTPIVQDEGYFLDPQVAAGKIYALEDVTHKMRFRVSEIHPETGSIREVVPEVEFDQPSKP